MKILIIDDDKDICSFLTAHLPAKGFNADAVNSGEIGIGHAVINDYDLILLDLNLPDMSGEDVIKAIRQKGEKMPILVFSVVSNTESKVRLLNSGADDYLVKPFSFEELVARLRAILRRPNNLVSNIITIDDLELNISKQTVSRSGEELSLTRKEFSILEVLMRSQGEIISKSALIESVWQSDSNPFSDSLDTHMTNLRKKLGEPELIHTVYGRGYRI